MKYLFSIILATLLLLGGCSSKPISGTITDKIFVPAHTEPNVMILESMILPYDDDIPDCYYITVVDAENYEHKIKVEKDFYDKTAIGDRFSTAK